MAGIAYSSRHSEEGFHSGSSQDDMLYAPVMDRLATEFGHFNIQQKRESNIFVIRETDPKP